MARFIKVTPSAFYKKPVFDNPIYVTTPFIFLSDEIEKTKEVDDEQT